MIAEFADRVITRRGKQKAVRQRFIAYQHVGNRFEIRCSFSASNPAVCTRSKARTNARRRVADSTGLAGQISISFG